LLLSENVTVPDSHGNVPPTGPQVPVPVKATELLALFEPAWK
jgi:hypothetical protein